MTKDEELAMDLALEALEMVVVDVKTTPTAYEAHRQAITAIKQARSAPVQEKWGASAVMNPDYMAAQKQKSQQALDKMAENARALGLDYEPVQEPVAYLCENAVGHKYFRWKKPSSEFKPIALYTTPLAAQRQWVGLTDEEREQHRDDWRSNIHDKEFRAIEAKLKEKNT